MRGSYQLSGSFSVKQISTEWTWSPHTFQGLPEVFKADWHLNPCFKPWFSANKDSLLQGTFGQTAKLLIIPIESPRLHRAKGSRHLSVGCFRATRCIFGWQQSMLGQTTQCRWTDSMSFPCGFNRNIRGLAKSPTFSGLLLLFNPLLCWKGSVSFSLPWCLCRTCQAGRAFSKWCPTIIPIQHTSGSVGSSLKSWPQTFMPNRYCKVKIKICC